jgi:DNA-binding CsgD family transcriptional regulator
VAAATRAYIALCEAEAARLAASPDPGPWRLAAGAWKSLLQPYPQAYAHWRRAEALCNARRTGEAAKPLRLAHSISLRIGAKPLALEIELLAQRARIALPAADTSLPPPTPEHSESHVDAGADTGLTARQLEVLALIAEGRTNREIAEALFITEKTAGAHVSSILGRLGVRSRVEAATWAHRRHLFTVASK